MIVVLSPEQIAYCERIAGGRQSIATRLGLKNTHELPESESQEAHVRGACCEGATAEALKIAYAWNRVRPDGPGGADFFDWLEVRGTKWKTGCLAVHEPERDDPDSVYLLVTENRERRRYVLVGWLYGHEAQQPEFWWEGDRSPYFKVPQHKLRPVSELQEMILTNGVMA